MRQPDQLALFESVAQPRFFSKERISFYNSVLALRFKGCRVYRAGRDAHLLNGKRVTALQVVSRAKRQFEVLEHFSREGVIVTRELLAFDLSGQ